MVEPHLVREQAGDMALEGVEPGERVVPHAEQHVHRKLWAPDELTQGAAERLDLLARVVDEELLELVEDEIQVPVQRAGDLRRIDEGGRALHARRCSDRRRERLDGVVEPGLVDDYERLLGQAPQVARDGCAQERALPHAARAVEDRQARGDEVGGDDLALLLAAEEEQGVELRVLERRQALVRARGPGTRRRPGGGRHATTLPGGAVSIRAASSATYSSSWTSKASTPRWRQYSTESASCLVPTAHDR
jgi:hypothetical protein